MKLYEELGQEFTDSLKSVFEREAKEPKYLRQTILGCRWRAFKGLTIAFVKALPIMVNMGGFAIARHREVEHKEDKTKTIKSIMGKLTGEQIERASTSISPWLV